jgi:hypothetical protein
MVFAVAALGLALGVGVGFAAPAFADTGFTATVSGAPLMADVTRIDFSGTKSSTSAITDESVNIEGSFTCSGLAAGSSTWVCEFNSIEEIGADHYSAQFVVTNVDNTESTQVLSFVVHGATESPAPDATPTSPLVGYQFTPQGVSITTTATGDANAASTVISGVGEGTFDVADCPDGTGTDFPLGTNPTTPITCSSTDSLYSYTGYVAQSQQGTVTPRTTTVSPDQSNGVFYVPYDDVNNADSDPSALPVGYTVNSSALTVTVTGSVGESTFDGGSVVILDNNGGIVCRTAVFTPEPSDPDAYDWTCITGALSYGTHNLVAAVEDTGEGIDSESYYLGDVDATYGYYVAGALSSTSTVGAVTFTAPVLPGGNTTTGDTTPTWSFTIGGDLTDVHPGDTLDISGSGLPSGTALDTILHSVPTDLGAVVAAADGTFAQTVTIPTGTELGDHTIMVTASGAGITTTTKQQAITVTAVPASAGSSSGSSGKSDVTTTKPTATHDAGEGDTGTGIAPNILTRALTPFADVAVHPNKIISAFEIGLVLLLLAVLPAHLLNATIAEQSERFERRFPKLHAPRWLTTLIGWFRSAPVVGGIVVTLATAILFGFADPKFGFTLASLRLILACGIALFLVGYVANWLTGVIARVQWDIVAAVSTRPYGLILTIVGVLISRLLDFSPGFLIGLILGLTIQGRSAAGFAWRTVVLRTSIVLIMAIAAWIGYSTITLGGDEGGTFGSALLVETLVAITTEGVVALLVELLPLRFLEGERVYAHSRVLWGIFYVLTLVVFVLAVVPWEGNWDALGSSLWIWVGVLALFALVCVGVYIYFRRFAKPLEEEAGEEKVALGESVGSDQ